LIILKCDDLSPQALAEVLEKWLPKDELYHPEM
jgi:hypothetical protein